MKIFQILAMMSDHPPVSQTTRFYMLKKKVHFTFYLKDMCQIHYPICVLTVKEINWHLKSFPEGKRTDLYLRQEHLCLKSKQFLCSAGEHSERQVLTEGHLSPFIQAEVLC